MSEKTLYIGLMSGTSMDSIDAGLFDIRDDRCLTLATHSVGYPPELQKRLWDAGRHPERCSIDEVASLDTWVGRCFADAARELIGNSRCEPDRIRAIGSHGQTLRHHPEADPPFTIQVGDPNIIAASCKITTVADFRRRDLALGGQGAPLATAFHRAFLGDENENRVVLNIGGIANVTILPAGRAIVSGFDTGPGNTLLDAWIRATRNLPCDYDGEWAASGKVIDPLLRDLRDDAYFARLPPKSTGFEHFNLEWLGKKLTAFDDGSGFTGEDVQATLVALTAGTIAEAIRRYAEGTSRVLVCGGGISNPVLMRELGRAMPGTPIESTAEYGIDPGWVEAATFAWLAKRRLDEQAGNLPSVTGASAEAVLGGVYHAGTGAPR